MASGRCGSWSSFSLPCSLSRFVPSPTTPMHYCTHTPLPPVPLPVLPPSRHTPPEPEPHSTVMTALVKASYKKTLQDNTRPFTPSHSSSYCTDVQYNRSQQPSTVNSTTLNRPYRFLPPLHPSPPSLS
jgi:hypothetical protein